MTTLVKANLSWINDWLATGGDLSYEPQIAVQQVEDIVHQGVGLIIDMREEANDAEIWDRQGIAYLHLPTTDAVGHTIPSRLFDRAVAEAINAKQQGYKVFIHCHMGVNRGPSVAFAALLADGMDPITAHDLIREKRPQAGLMYVMDALKAHQERGRVPYRLRIAQRQVFQDHLDAVWTLEEIGKIRRVIREGHAADRAAWQRVFDAQK